MPVNPWVDLHTGIVEIKDLAFRFEDDNSNRPPRFPGPCQMRHHGEHPRRCTANYFRNKLQLRRPAQAESSGNETTALRAEALIPNGCSASLNIGTMTELMAPISLCLLCRMETLSSSNVCSARSFRHPGKNSPAIEISKLRSLNTIEKNSNDMSEIPPISGTIHKIWLVLPMQRGYFTI